MILGHIDNLDDENIFYPEVLRKGLAYIKNTDFSAMADGKYEIDGENMFAIVSKYTPDAKENRKTETHIKYIDIQYIHSGEELIGFSRLSDKAEISEEYSEEKDATFYNSVENENYSKVSAGMYALCFPWDIHRPGCTSQPDVIVHKVVLKIKTSALDEK
ncbi:YhcH/YjgK/YiaL family protein [Pelosinus sp. sgz500959]|uniref:YhcH/YjgK/YiaL family protein n=1 Tax=Pelosinus sp. sgz500959 TaxID=3242472 RepID=UPI003671CC9D